MHPTAKTTKAIASNSEFFSFVEEGCRTENVRIIELFDAKLRPLSVIDNELSMV